MNLINALPEGEYDRRIDQVREDVCRNLYSVNTLDGIKNVLSHGVWQLNNLKRKHYVDKNTPVQRCVTHFCYAIALREYCDYWAESEKIIQDEFTVEKLARIPLHRLEEAIGIKDAHIKALKQLVKSVGLKFPQV